MGKGASGFCILKTKQLKNTFAKNALNLKLLSYLAPTALLVAYHSQGNGITCNFSAFEKIS